MVSLKKSKINEFKNDNGELIEAFDDFIVEFCLVSGLADANEFVADGTFLDGYCNDFKAQMKLNIFKNS